MMKRVKLSTCAKWLALGLLVVVNSSYAASRVKTAAQAIQCQPDTQENGYNGTCLEKRYGIGLTAGGYP